MAAGVGRGRAGFGKDEEAVFADRRVERRAIFLPVGQQLAQRTRVHDGAGENVGADFGTFLDQADIDVGSLVRRQLLEPDGRGQTGGAAADDDDVEFHGFALHAVSSIIVAL
jgi:hypothetical protein